MRCGDLSRREHTRGSLDQTLEAASNQPSRSFAYSAALVATARQSSIFLSTPSALSASSLARRRLQLAGHFSSPLLTTRLLRRRPLKQAASLTSTNPSPGSRVVTGKVQFSAHRQLCGSHLAARVRRKLHRVAGVAGPIGASFRLRTGVPNKDAGAGPQGLSAGQEEGVR